MILGIKNNAREAKADQARVRSQAQNMAKGRKGYREV